MRQEIKRRRRGSRQYIIKKKRKKGINKKLLFCGLEKVEFLFAFSQKKGEREIKKNQNPALSKGFGWSLTLSLAKEKRPTNGCTRISRARNRARSSRVHFASFCVVQSSKKNKKTLSRDYDSLWKVSWLCTKSATEEGHQKRKKKKSFPKSTLANHHATVRAPLRLFGQFRLEHEIVPLHFLYICLNWFEPFELRCVCVCYACFRFLGTKQLKRNEQKNLVQRSPKKMQKNAKKIWKLNTSKICTFLSSLFTLHPIRYNNDNDGGKRRNNPDENGR